LISGINAANAHGEVNFGRPVGKEANTVKPETILSDYRKRVAQFREQIRAWKMRGSSF
jgi:hypothetical protein